jgi:hypothetical protein
MKDNRIPPHMVAAAARARPEAGITYDGKLVRDMTDQELETYLPRAQGEFKDTMIKMQQMVEQYAVLMAITNVLAFEHDRRQRSIKVIGSLS